MLKPYTLTAIQNILLYDITEYCRAFHCSKNNYKVDIDITEMMTNVLLEYAIRLAEKDSVALSLILDGYYETEIELSQKMTDEQF